MRIHKTHKRYISSVVAGLIVTAVTMTGFSYNDKTVTVMVDGAAHTVRTHLNSNEGIVRDAGVKLNPNDKVISSSTSVQNGTTLTVVRAIPVYVTVMVEQELFSLQKQRLKALLMSSALKHLTM